MFWVGVAVGVVAGGILIFGLVFSYLIDKWYVGRLNKDESIVDEPYYFMEIDPGRADKLKHNKRVLLNVCSRNYLDTK